MSYKNRSAKRFPQLVISHLSLVIVMGIQKMGSTNIRQQARVKRKKRIRKKINGTTQRPRLSVFRSARHIYAQVVDDAAGHTLVAASTMDKEVRSGSKFENKVDAAKESKKLYSIAMVFYITVVSNLFQKAPVRPDWFSSAVC